MIKTISLKELRPRLPRVADDIEKRMARYVVTRRGKPVMMLVSPDDYEGLIETIEIMSDKELVKRIEKAEKDIREGKTVPWEVVRKRLERI